MPLLLLQGTQIRMGMLLQGTISTSSATQALAPTREAAALPPQSPFGSVLCSSCMIHVMWAEQRHLMRLRVSCLIPLYVRSCGFHGSLFTYFTDLSPSPRSYLYALHNSDLSSALLSAMVVLNKCLDIALPLPAGYRRLGGALG